MKLLLGAALFCAIVVLFAADTVLVAVRHDGAGLILVGSLWLIGFGFVGRSLENQRLKKQIRELEMRLGL
jgi:hypothetical protein